MGHAEKALPIIREAQALFRKRAAGKPSSLIAKAGMSIAKLLLKLAKLESSSSTIKEMHDEAVTLERENVEIFEITCGEDSPLTASALKGLGEALPACDNIPEACEAFGKSYKWEAMKDAFDLLAIMEVHGSLVSALLASAKITGGLNRGAFRDHVSTVQMALKRVRSMLQDGNAGAYYKVAGELLAFAEDYTGAAALLMEACALFTKEANLPGKQAEKPMFDGLIQTCQELQVFCESQVSKPKPAAS